VPKALPQEPCEPAEPFRRLKDIQLVCLQTMAWKYLCLLVSHSFHLLTFVLHMHKKWQDFFTSIREIKGPATFFNALRNFGISGWAETDSITEIYSSFDDQGLRESTH